MRTTTTALLALLILAWSVAVIAGELRTHPVRQLALDLERGGTAVRITRAEAAIVEDGWCLREMVQANVAIRLAILDASFRDDDTHRRTAALAKTHQTLRDALICFPLNGNLWLRLAMVESAQGRDQGRVAEMLRMSLAHAPSEGWIVAPRILFAARLKNAPGVADKVLETDLPNLLRFARISDIANVYSEADDDLRSMIIAGLKQVDTKQRLAIENAIGAAMESETRK